MSPRRVQLVIVCILFFLTFPVSARAGAPRGFLRWRGQRPPAEWMVSARASVSSINFSRPERACGGALFCPADDSNELAVGFGVGAAFRVRAPLYLSFGLDVSITDPEFDVLEPQTMVTVPFGILLTASEWDVRPIAEALAVPFFLIPDGVKNVMFGGRLGVAVRIGEVDLSLSLGYAEASALRPWEVRLTVVHLP